MLRGKDGQALFSGLINGIVQFSGGEFSKLASMPPLPNFLVISMSEMPDGQILTGTRDRGLFQFIARQASPGRRAMRDLNSKTLLSIAEHDSWRATDQVL